MADGLRVVRHRVTGALGKPEQSHDRKKNVLQAMLKDEANATNSQIDCSHQLRVPVTVDKPD